MEKKNQPNKQTKIANLKYEKLEMQDYFVDGNCKKQIAQVIYKARTQALDIKTHNRWKYDDDICVGCNTGQETIEEILSCRNLGKNNEERRSICCNWLISGSSRRMFIVGKILVQRLNTRGKLIEGIT